MSINLSSRVLLVKDDRPTPRLAVSTAADGTTSVVINDAGEALTALTGSRRAIQQLDQALRFGSKARPLLAALLDYTNNATPPGEMPPPEAQAAAELLDNPA